MAALVAHRGADTREGLRAKQSRGEMFVQISKKKEEKIHVRKCK